MKIEINDAYESLISVFLAFVLVLNYFINVNLYNLELVAVVLMIAIALLFRTQIHIYKYNIYWMLAAVVPLISCFYSPYQRASFQYCMLLIFFIINIIQFIIIFIIIIIVCVIINNIFIIIIDIIFSVVFIIA